MYGIDSKSLINIIEGNFKRQDEIEIQLSNEPPDNSN